MTTKTPDAEQLASLAKYGVTTSERLTGAGDTQVTHQIQLGKLWSILSESGIDPNPLTRWFAGEKTNPLAQTAKTAGLSPDNFYINTDAQIEVGYIEFPPNGISNLADVNGKIHEHPYCTEHFVVIQGQVELLVDANSVIRLSDVTDPKDRYDISDGASITVSPDISDVPGVEYFYSESGSIARAQFSVDPNSFHHILRATPGTKLLLIKTPNLQGENQADWTQTRVHECELN